MNKIIDKRDLKREYYEDIKVGKAFKFDDKIYIKTSIWNLWKENNDYVAVNLATGGECRIESKVKVEPIEIEIHIIE